MLDRDGSKNRKGQWILIGGIVFLIIASTVVMIKSSSFFSEPLLVEDSLADNAVFVSSLFLQNATAEPNSTARVNYVVAAFDTIYVSSKERMMDLEAAYMILYCNDTNAEIQVINLLSSNITNVNITIGSAETTFDVITPWNAESSVISRPSLNSSMYFKYNYDDEEYCFHTFIKSCSLYQGMLKLSSSRGVWSLPVGVMEEC